MGLVGLGLLALLFGLVPFFAPADSCDVAFLATGWALCFLESAVIGLVLPSTAIATTPRWGDIL